MTETTTTDSLTALAREVQTEVALVVGNLDQYEDWQGMEPLTDALTAARGIWTLAEPLVREIEARIAATTTTEG